MERWVIFAVTVAYFWLWGHYSGWSVYDMLFHGYYSGDVIGSIPNVGTFARLGVGFMLLIASVLALTAQRDH